MIEGLAGAWHYRKAPATGLKTLTARADGVFHEGGTHRLIRPRAQLSKARVSKTHSGNGASASASNAANASCQGRSACVGDMSRTSQRGGTQS